MNRVSAAIISSREVMSGAYLTWLGAPEIAAEAKPGQFVMVRCGEGCLLRRPLSIHRVVDEKLALLFRVIGKGTEWLSQRRQGEFLDLFGPLGRGFDIQRKSKKLLLVAGGIGIAPLCFVSGKALEQGCSVTLLLGASTASQLYPRELLPPEAELIIAAEDGTAGKKGMITDFLLDFVGWADQVFACGPTSMYRAIAIQKQQFPEKPVQVSLEVRMGCGRGVCYGCTVRTKSGLKQVCKDGPVFDLDDILWDELNYY